MTTAERVVIKAFPWVALGLIAACVVIYFLLRSGSDNGDTFRRDREASNRREQSFQEELATRKAHISTLEKELQANVHRQGKANDSLKTQIKWLRSRLRPIPPNSTELEVADYTCCEQAVLRDSVITVQDTLISSLETQKGEILASHAVIVGELKTHAGLLDSANTAKHMKLDSAYVKLADLSDKVGSQKKVITFLGGVSAVVTAILVVILAF